MNYTPEYFWKNFRLGTELQISGAFIYNALYFFDQMEHFCDEEETFEFLYNTSVGIERLEKIAVILLEHSDTIDQKQFEETLKTHSHLELLDRIKKKKSIKLGKAHNKFIQLLSNFYKSMRYNRYGISSVYEPDQDSLKLRDFIQKELNIKIKTGWPVPTANSDDIKNFIGKIVGEIATQLYNIIWDESSKSNMYTYEIRYGSKAYKIFKGCEFTFHNENHFKKEILVHLLNGKNKDGFIEFIQNIKPIPLEGGITHEYVKYLLNPHKNINMLDELYASYEDNLDKERHEIVSCIGNDGVSFERDKEREDFFNYS